MLRKLKSLFKKTAPNNFGKTKHIIKPAFTVGGIDYFEFDTTANLPFKRGLKFLSVYNELDMRCDRFYLTKHVEAIEKTLTGGKKVGLDEIIKIRQLNSQMKERLQWVYHEDLVYKLASVVFFDAHENPDDWEWKYAAEKIERWKNAEDVNAFFLHEPIQRLIPFLKDSNLNFHDYSAMGKQIDKVMLDNIYAMLWDKANANLPTFTERYFLAETKANSV